MKRCWKWGVSSFIIMSILIFLGVVLTGTKVSEEASEFGKTVLGTTTATTYMKELDISFQTKKEFKRYFKDTKAGVRSLMNQSGMYFVAFPDDEAHILEIRKDCIDLDGISVRDLGDASDEEFQKFQSQVENYTLEEKKPYATGTAFSYDIDTIGDYKYVVSTYKRYAAVWAEYDVVRCYTTVINGHSVDFMCYCANANDVEAADVIDEIEQVADVTLLTLEAGNATAGIKSGDGFFSKFSAFTFGIWIFAIPLFFLFFSNMLKKKEDGEWFDDALSLETTKSIRGIMAMCIVLHHLIQHIGAQNAGPIGFMERMGVCFVGVFFFYSGYGLVKSFYLKEHYLNGFLKKRLPSILVPFYVCNILFIVVALLTGSEMSLSQGLLYLSGFYLINSQAWYIVEMAIFYALFALIFRFIKGVWKPIGCMILALILFTLASLLLGHGNGWFQGEWWYNTSLLFGVGMIFERIERPVTKMIRKRYKLCCVAVTLLFALFYGLTEYQLQTRGYWTETELSHGYIDKLVCLSFQLPMVFFFVMLLFVFGQKLKCQNAAIRFLGKISLEIYLIHNIFILHLNKVTGNGMFMLFVFFGAVVAGYLLHKMDVYILHIFFQGKKEPKVDLKPILKKKKQEWSYKINAIITYGKRHPKRVVQLILRTLIVIVITAITILPLYIMYVNATKTSMQISRGFSLIPQGHFEENLSTFLKGYESGEELTLVRSLWNSVVVALGYCLLATYFGSMTAYAFEYYRFRGRKILWSILVASIMLPGVVTIIGFTKMVLFFGLINSYIPLILPAIASPATVYFMRMYLRMVPMMDIIEAARLEGCGELRIFNRIILPALKPAISLQIIFTFVNCWNNSMVPSMILIEQKKRVIASYLKGWTYGTSAGSNPVTYVMLIVASLPPIIIYAFFAKYITARIVIGAVKE